MKKMAILTMNREVFEELAKLDDESFINLFPQEAEVELLQVEIPFDRPNIVEIKAKGVGWPVNDGCAIPRTEPAILIKKDDGSLFVDFRLPK